MEERGLWPETGLEVSIMAPFSQGVLMSSSKSPKLPLPSCCGICHTTIHAALIRDTSRGEHTFSRRQVVVWFHDATLGTIVRRGGPHDAIPDPTYAPARARIVGPVLQSAVEATRDWRIASVMETDVQAAHSRRMLPLAA